MQRQWFDHRETRGRRNNQIFHAVNQRMTAISAVDRETTTTSVPWYVVLPEAMTTKVDCDVGCKIAPRNNQQKIHRIASTRATSRHPIARRTVMSIFYCRVAMSKQPPDLDQSVRLLITVYSIKLKGINQRMIIPL